MAGAAKFEFPPLLPVGFHEISLPELRDVCVTAFPGSGRREGLFRNVEAICTSLSVALIRSEVWVDGSFLTKKTEPDDVDLVVLGQWESYQSGSNEHRALWDRIAHQQFGTQESPCDSYVHFDYPEGHTSYGIGPWMRADWIRQFGFSRGRDFKGIALVRTPLS